jgi:hypothetical protein
MVVWTIVMAGIVLIGVVIIFKRKQRQADHLAYWQQQREFEQRKGEVASQQPDSQARQQKMDQAQASVERIDGELSRLAGSKGSVGHHVS